MRRKLVIILATVVAALVVYDLYYPFSPIARQTRNMRMAEEFIPVVRKAIADDPRFKYIKLFPFTGEDGSIGVEGVVRSGDLAELKRRVEKTSPPVNVAWLVKEYPEPYFSELVGSSEWVP